MKEKIKYLEINMLGHLFCHNNRKIFFFLQKGPFLVLALLLYIWI